MGFRQAIQQAIQRELKLWRVGALPGLVVLGLVLVSRITGTMQPLEWIALDSFLRWRPPEPIDPRITIVGINEGDIQALKAYPVPDAQLAALIQKLQSYRPRAIGLDIFRDIPVEPGHAQLAQVFRQSPNLIAIDRVAPDAQGFTVGSPPTLAPQQVGFADVILDRDGRLRRSLLGFRTQTDYRFSFGLLLAQRYLEDQGIPLSNGLRDPVAMRFGDVELTRFQPNSGGYVGAYAGGNQILLNFRSGPQQFRMVSLRAVMGGAVDPSWLRDRVVIIGVTAASIKDVVNTGAVAQADSQTDQVYGVVVQAHAVSQLLSAVLDGRPLLNTWPDGWEYLWIGLWWGMGFAFIRLSPSVWRALLAVGLTAVSLTVIAYYALILGWWLPLVPSLLALGLNGLGLITSFYQYHQSLKAQVEERQMVIDQTFDAIHNGPLQTLARLRRQLASLPPEAPTLESGPDVPVSLPQLQADLDGLNRELRAVYESVRRESLQQEERIRLGSGQEISLQIPLHEIFQEIFSETLARDVDFPQFKSLKVKIRRFDPIEDPPLTLEQKRGLCRFLEEAIGNVGKYAVAATWLKVTYTQEQGRYVLRVVDNGQGDYPTYKGRGTQQAENLARQLRGQFQRQPQSPHGLICELVWPTAQRPKWQFWG